MSLDSAAKTIFINGVVSDMKQLPGGKFMDEDSLRRFATVLSERIVTLVKNGQVTVTQLNTTVNVQ